MGLKRGAVVIASIGTPSGKPRPFLLLRANQFSDHSLVTILPFTSTLIDAPTLRVAIEAAPENGLQSLSQVMIDQVQSVPTSRIGRMIGELAATDMQVIARMLMVYLGFAD